VPVVDVGGVGGQRAHPVAEPEEQLGGGEQPQPRGGQLKRQGEPVEPDADLRERLAVGRRDLEGRVERSHVPDQESDGGACGQQAGVVDLRRTGQGERGDVHLPFGAQVQPLPAGHQDGQARVGRQQVTQPPRRRQHVLEVVEHHEYLLAGQRLGEPPTSDRAGLLTVCARDLGRDQVRVANRREVDEDCTVGEVGGGRGGRGEAQPRLAHAGRPGQRDQPRVGVGQ
jgi:hypothetical protein